MIVKIEKKELGGLLRAGDHIGTITEAGIEFSKENSSWKDRTPQLKIVIRNAKGMITAWLNLRGYKNATDSNGIAPKGFTFASFNDDSEKFLVGKDGKRVVSSERTAKLATNVANLGYAIEEEGEFDSDKLVDYANSLLDSLLQQEVGVRVRESATGKLEANYFMKASEVEVGADIPA